MLVLTTLLTLPVLLVLLALLVLLLVVSVELLRCGVIGTPDVVCVPDGTGVAGQGYWWLLGLLEFICTEGGGWRGCEATGVGGNWDHRGVPGSTGTTPQPQLSIEPSEPGGVTPWMGAGCNPTVSLCPVCVPWEVPGPLPSVPSPQDHDPRAAAAASGAGTSEGTGECRSIPRSSPRPPGALLWGRGAGGGAGTAAGTGGRSAGAAGTVRGQPGAPGWHRYLGGEQGRWGHGGCGDQRYGGCVGENGRYGKTLEIRDVWGCLRDVGRQWGCGGHSGEHGDKDMGAWMGRGWGDMDDVGCREMWNVG